MHRIETAPTPGAGPPAAVGQLPPDVPAAERLRRLREDLLGGYGKGASQQQFLSVTRERPLAVATRRRSSAPEKRGRRCPRRC